MWGWFLLAVVGLLTLGYYNQGTTETQSPLVTESPRMTFQNLPPKRIQLSTKYLFNQDKFSQVVLKSKNGFFGTSRKQKSLDMLTNSKNIMFYTNISIGEPAQSISVIFDTDLSHSWLISSECNDLACLYHKTYNSSESSTSKTIGTPFVVVDESSSVSGQLVADNIVFDQFELYNEIFGLIEEIKGERIRLVDYDGIIGLGLEPTNDVGDHIVPFVQHMIDSGLISEQIFSVYLRKNQSQSQLNSELIFGGIDQSYFVGEIIYTPLTDEGKWQIKLDNIIIDKNDSDYSKKVLCQNDCQAIVRLGSPYIVGPKEEASELNNYIGASHLPDDTWILSTCNFADLPSLIFSIEGQELKLKPEQYVIEITKDDERYGKTKLCYSGIKSSNDSSAWILGDILMESYYTIFDYANKRIGFAQQPTI